ncbi:MAG: hypothetical protein FJ023_08460 [Chloroflexi bacterium]|nr:hypothetical protein [Chloroflexota bacterium]
MGRGLLLLMMLLMSMLIILPACQGTPPSFEIISLNVTPPEVAAGDTATITIQVKNTSGMSGIYPATLVLDGVSIQTKVIEIGSRKTAAISFTVSKDKPGIYNIKVNDQSGIFKVLKPANLIMTNLYPTPLIATPGQTMTVSVDVTNTGEATGSQSVAFTVDGSQVESKEIKVAPGATEKLSFTTAKNTAGIYSVKLGSLPGFIVVSDKTSQQEQPDSIYPELYKELIKLPDLQEVDDKGKEAIEDIIGLALNQDNKSAFESMLGEGVKDKRKYCTPLEALLWIAYDQEFDVNNPLKGFSLDKFIHDAWQNTTTSQKYTSGKWQDFDTVVSRLNSPTLIARYILDNIIYESKIPEILMGKLQIISPRKVFNEKKAACYSASGFELYCLLQNGYEYDDFENHQNYAACMLHAYPTLMGGHFVGLYIQNGSYYAIDVIGGRNSGIVGPFKTVEAAADKIVPIWMGYSLVNLDSVDTKQFFK